MTTAASTDQAIEAFWAWWAENEDRIAAVMGQPLPDELLEALSDAVRRIDAGLAWEFGPGRRAPHALSLSGEGDPLLRMVAERWRRVGPGDGEHFEFYPTRQPVRLEHLLPLEIEYGPLVVPFSAFSCATARDAARLVLDLSVHHPAFAGADQDLAKQVAFIALDQALGEDGVERWIGRIDVVDTPPPGGVDLAAIVRQVEALAEETKEAGGAWIMGEGEEDGMPVIYVLDAGVKRWDHPFADTSCIVRIAYPDRGDGLPEPEGKDEVDALEDRLLAELGDQVVHIGHRTGAGDRLVFLYVDGESDAPDRLREWVNRCPLPAQLELEHDPAWVRRP